MTQSDARPALDSIAEIEALDRSRRHMLLAVVATSTCWLLPQILRGVLGDGLPSAVNAAMVIAGVAGALAWVVFMFRFHRFQTRIRGNPELRRQLDDERVRDVRREAVFRGWVVLVVALGIGVGVAPFVDLPDQAVLTALLLLGVNAPLVSFLVLDRG